MKLIIFLLIVISHKNTKKKSIANDVNKKDAENKFYASFISY